MHWFSDDTGTLLNAFNLPQQWHQETKSSRGVEDSWLREAWDRGPLRAGSIGQRGPIRVPQQSGIYNAALTPQVHMQLEGFDVFSDLHGYTRLFAPKHLLATNLRRLPIVGLASPLSLSSWLYSESPYDRDEKLAVSTRA